MHLEVRCVNELGSSLTKLCCLGAVAVQRLDDRSASILTADNTSKQYLICECWLIFTQLYALLFPDRRWAHSPSLAWPMRPITWSVLFPSPPSWTTASSPHPSCAQTVSGNTAQTAGPVCRLDLELSAKSRPPTWNVNTARTGVFLDLIGRKTLGPIDNVVSNSNSILTVVEDSCCLFFQPVKFYWVQTTWSANHVSNQVSHICLLIL